MSNICRRCGHSIWYSLIPAKSMVNGLCHFCVRELKDLTDSLDETREQSLNAFKIKMQMLSSKPDSATAVVEIDGKVSLVRDCPIDLDTTPQVRDKLLITRAFIQQDKERPSNDD